MYIGVQAQFFVQSLSAELLFFFLFFYFAGEDIKIFPVFPFCLSLPLPKEALILKPAVELRRESRASTAATGAEKRGRGEPPALDRACLGERKNESQ